MLSSVYFAEGSGFVLKHLKITHIQYIKDKLRTGGGYLDFIFGGGVYWIVTDLANCPLKIMLVSLHIITLQTTNSKHKTC